MKDLQIIPAEEGDVEFYPRGASEDTGLMLLQRLYVMLFSDQTESYREGDGGYTLWNFIEGGNIPVKPIFDSVLATSCASAVNMLDAEDRAVIASFSGEGFQDGSALLTLTLTDGTTVKGRLNNG